MPKLRILFMGTPEFAVESLKQLHQNFEICGVVTAPDKPAGRGRKLKQSAIKSFALTEKIEVLQPTNLKAETFTAHLNRLKPNLIVVVAFRMLPKQVWDFPELGTFNIHASLLPKYRGAAPINWAVINDEEKTGVTSFFLDEKIDTGAIISQSEILIEPNDTAGSLHDKLMDLGAELAVKTCRQIEAGQIETKIQPKQASIHAPKLTKENTQIDWQQEATTINNFVKGLNPYPLAWTSFLENDKENTVKIAETIISEIDDKGKTGDIKLTKKQLFIKAKDAWVEVKKLKYPGKKLLSTSDFLNGYNKPNSLKTQS